MKYYVLSITIAFGIISSACRNQPNTTQYSIVPQDAMEEIYNEVKTPFKYGIVLEHPDSTVLMDSPTIFREKGVWYMTYILFDGKGYETWIAESVDLLHWKTKGKILSFTENTWDANQKAGYLSLVDFNWE